MSSAPLRPTPDPQNEERRSHPRRRLDQLAYIGFGPDIGGVLLDISEDGLRCQIVGSFIEGDHCHLKFALPGTRAPMEVDGQVAWSNASQQGGGVRFLGLSPDARRSIQQWIQDEIAATGARKPIPIRVRAKIPAVAHLPHPGAPVTATPAPEPPAPPRKIHTAPVSRRSKAAAEARVAATAARKNALAKRRTPQTVGPASAARLAESLEWHQTTRSTNMPAVVLLGCILGALAALGLSGFNYSDLRSLAGLADTTSPAVAPAAAPAAIPPDPPKAAAVTESQSPAPAGAAVDLDPHTTNTNKVARQETPVPNSVRATPQPQAPKAPAPVKRPQMPMTLPPPRAITPAAPAAALPELAAALIAPSPAVPPIDMSLVESPSPLPPTPVKPQVVSDYRLPQLISRIEPVYSLPAMQARVQGTVTVDVTVGPDGSTRSSVCIEGNALLCRMAVDAISKWHYQPATSNGLPVESQTRVNFNFQLH